MPHSDIKQIQNTTTVSCVPPSPMCGVKCELLWYKEERSEENPDTISIQIQIRSFTVCVMTVCVNYMVKCRKLARRGEKVHAVSWGRILSDYESDAFLHLAKLTFCNYHSTSCCGGDSCFQIASNTLLMPQLVSQSMHQFCRWVLCFFFVALTHLHKWKTAPSLHDFNRLWLNSNSKYLNLWKNKKLFCEIIYTDCMQNNLCNNVVTAKSS